LALHFSDAKASLGVKRNLAFSHEINFTWGLLAGGRGASRLQVGGAGIGGIRLTQRRVGVEASKNNPGGARFGVSPLRRRYGAAAPVVATIARSQYRMIRN